MYRKNIYELVVLLLFHLEHSISKLIIGNAIESDIQYKYNITERIKNKTTNELWNTKPEEKQRGKKLIIANDTTSSKKVYLWIIGYLLQNIFFLKQFRNKVISIFLIMSAY